ncbi:hypothetical protein H2O64_22730 [Kordia sp. YSTF-M3]|uniref:SGNH/GDSL hydrolase family protein n=1 Tax=Kordia aestuariivivens TaxID=2759037 RepID=A0ABR7QGQ6_9FLAO|nr:hypothetical protein [Kordia aestuariivivens]MBC8757504.1 hypothetical protein [Kordia aestuariivivens]
MKKKWVFIVYNVIIVLIIFGALECFLEYKLSHPENLNGRMKIACQKYYMNFDRKIIQYEPEMAKYDTKLFYVLKPGDFQFKNREFDVAFNVNSLGVRDDETSLLNPKIVVLGDSQAMGWGIPQEKTFAEVLEKETQKKVLNTAISSYGTVREFKLLQQINTENLQYIIIQYCENDYQENYKYSQNNNILKISSEESYTNASKTLREERSYHLFKHVLKFPRLIASANPEFDPIIKLKDDEVAVFLNVIKQSEVFQKEIKIIVININSRQTSNHFINNLKKTLQKNEWENMAKQVIPVDISSGLTADKYYVLDDHINTKGHAFIASELQKIINMHENAEIVK